jgi:GH15 family glucan-1,4-alpha-glucosidase
MIGASYQPIEDYGLIGDMHTVALVGKDGSIDFMSFPSFDSPTIFAALLDRRRGGRFSIAPDLSGSAQKAAVRTGHQRSDHAMALRCRRRRGVGLHARRSVSA